MGRIFYFPCLAAGQAMGNGFLPNLRWTILPQLLPRYGSAILYRFDINLRDAAILGFVGAGGIGTPLIRTMTLYQWEAAGAMLWGLVCLVTLVEIASERLRKGRK